MVGSVGASIPEDTQHAVSVSLPTWDANVGYEEGHEWVLSKMTTGYPRFDVPWQRLMKGYLSPQRFFIHKSIQKLAKSILELYGRTDELCFLFPSSKVASRCKQFISDRSLSQPLPVVRILGLTSLSSPLEGSKDRSLVSSNIYAVLFPSHEFSLAKEFWQHSGDGISSRRAEFCQCLLDEGLLVEHLIAKTPNLLVKGPKRYSRVSHERSLSKIVAISQDGLDTSRFVEERFGRNLDVGFVDSAKLAVRRRIAGTLRSDVALKDAMELSREGGRDVDGFTEEDVFLYPCGMSSIYNTHRVLIATLGPLKSVCYGFPYVDTLKILQKFGPGCHFYGLGSENELSNIEKKLESGERILALFCEFPSNPLLKSPDLLRIHNLANKYHFAVVIDETVGNFLNVHVLSYADVVVSSLTKIFSGDSNVMGGSMILNPKGRYYERIKGYLSSNYEDNVWSEDAIFLERNSRDFVSRIERINANAEVVCEILLRHQRIKKVYYPKYSPTKHFYDNCRCLDGGYGGLLSMTFHSQKEAALFFDNLATAKGPSLGTNFTLSSPYTLLAHYGELEWAAKCGVESNLVRVSIGLEDPDELREVFEKALDVLSVDR